jgi:hypothetical protein
LIGKPLDEKAINNRSMPIKTAVTKRTTAPGQYSSAIFSLQKTPLQAQHTNRNLIPVKFLAHSHNKPE